MATNQRAVQAYIEYVRDVYPEVYAAAIRNLQSQGLSALSLDFGGSLTQIMNSIGNVAGSVLQYKQQKALLDVQTARAQNGQLPVYVDPNSGAAYVPNTPSPAQKKQQQALVKSRNQAKLEAAVAKAKAETLKTANAALARQLKQDNAKQTATQIFKNPLTWIAAALGIGLVVNRKRRR